MSRRQAVPRPRLLVLVLAVVLLAACGNGGGNGGGAGPAVSISPGAETGKSTDDVTVDQLETMLLSVDELPEDLTGFVVGDDKPVPNEVKANTGGDDEPVTLDDPNYGDNLRNMNDVWVRLGGHVRKLERDAPQGEITAVELELSLTETEEGAQAFFEGWFASDANGCLDFGDASDCGGIRINIQGESGEEEALVGRSATFVIGRMVAEVGVDVTVPAEQEDTSFLDTIVEELSRMLYDKVQDQL
ncbi:MAG: hypothetical protein WD770_05535 [Actinomycetota bacterium]